MDKYTSFNLASRRYASEHIRGYVLALARCGWRELLVSLDAQQPLHEIREHSPAGIALWIAFNVASGLPDVATGALRDFIAGMPERQ